ncbi:hypothetical protein BKA00_005825 [Actinomadura coerulea]|uniref:Uncharacterized protein n=1 Tax=Actinomadura coerulea TaxID=46159 RepID=A0A7X0L1Q3_9ACTN|nr:hypothetical protein [Actinomadura coerulea]MBB6398911.1 hypothetical protein [Actinomadura coerulea]GGP98313.1 hypothetical protein GCM10010187_12410 [Actinomadura coerulea]
MDEIEQPPAAPAGLGEAGAALWADVVEVFELETAERRTLEQACRTADELERLAEQLRAEPLVVPGSMGQVRAHPLLAEVRAHRLLLGRLLDELALPHEGEDAGKTPRQRQASEAARVRWDLERARMGRGGAA